MPRHSTTRTKQSKAAKKSDRSPTPAAVRQQVALFLSDALTTIDHLLEQANRVTDAASDPASPLHGMTDRGSWVSVCSVLHELSGELTNCRVTVRPIADPMPDLGE